uniref:Uncharacterized protein n=1 Tax=Rhizophora mucronata TaxID=61149 RepID=A0A2P2JI73_RHIMU
MLTFKRDFYNIKNTYNDQRRTCFPLLFVHVSKQADLFSFTYLIPLTNCLTLQIIVKGTYTRTNYMSSIDHYN